MLGEADPRAAGCGDRWAEVGMVGGEKMTADSYFRASQEGAAPKW